MSKDERDAIKEKEKTLRKSGKGIGGSKSDKRRQAMNALDPSLNLGNALSIVVKQKVTKIVRNIKIDKSLLP